jgi:hypothetical protein
VAARAVDQQKEKEKPKPLKLTMMTTMTAL